MRGRDSTFGNGTNGPYAVKPYGPCADASIVGRPEDLSRADQPVGKSLGRRSFLRTAGRSLAAVGAAPLAGAGILEQCEGDPGPWGLPTTTTATTTTTTLAPRQPLTGYNLFSFAVERADAVQGVIDMRPGIVRWFVEWDRYQSSGPRPVSWERSMPWLRALGDVGSKLYVQFWVQHAVPEWARMEFSRNIPRPGTFEAFVDGLEDAVSDVGLDVIWGMYNEADLRFGLRNLDGSLDTSPGPTENYHQPWAWSASDPFRGYALWTGGLGEHWERLYAQGSRTYTTSGTINRAWIESTAPHCDIIDIHLYMVGRDVSYYLSRVRDQIAIWDAVRPGLPFLIGEIASASSPDHPGLPNNTPQEKGLIRERHAALAREWGERYQGMLSLSEGQPWNDTVGWWEA